MNPVAAYQVSRVNGASPARLVVMLYDRLLGSVEEGRQALADGRLMEAQPPLLRAQRIACELLSALEPGGGEITENLRNLYVYSVSAIEKAKTSGESAHLEGATRALEPLREAWCELARAAETAPEADAVHTAPADGGARRPLLARGVAA